MLRRQLVVRDTGDSAFADELHQTVWSWRRFETPVGEQRTEGSAVNPNMLSRVDVRIDESACDIRLLRGEATFKVAPDPSRPFRVHTQRKLMFKRTAFEEMATEFNCYDKATQIRLESIEPGRLRFTGAFRADDPQSLAALLTHEPDLAVTRERDEIAIRPRGGQAAGRAMNHPDPRNARVSAPAGRTKQTATWQMLCQVAVFCWLGD